MEPRRHRRGDISNLDKVQNFILLQWSHDVTVVEMRRD